MATILLTTAFKRKEGMLYYAGTSPEGFITLCEVAAARGRKKDKDKKKE